MRDRAIAALIGTMVAAAILIAFGAGAYVASSPTLVPSRSGSPAPSAFVPLMVPNPDAWCEGGTPAQAPDGRLWTIVFPKNAGSASWWDVSPQPLVLDATFIQGYEYCAALSP